MKRQSIRNHIDRKIEERLSQVGFSETRQNLLETSRRFLDRIPQDVELKEEVLEKITHTKTKYFGLYVLWAQKRIIDLYKIEMKDIKGLSPLKKFKALKFKEKLEGI
jgi:hypothetical protein